MIYKKDSNLKYWELAKYIDDNIRKDDCDENKCFEYMYHLFYVLAVKGKFFQVSSDYDNYAIYGATQLFLRYKKEKNKNLKKQLKPIKSSLNYIKRILYPLKVNYQKESFGQIFQEDALNGESPTQIFEDKIKEANNINNNLMQVEYKYYLTQLASTIKQVINNSPYVNNPVILHNLYLSCILTILKTITMSNKNINRLKNKENKLLPVTNLIDQIYAEERKDDIVIFHLDISMKNYISTLVNKIKKEIVKDLRCIIGSFELPDSIIKDILISPIEELSDNEY